MAANDLSAVVVPVTSIVGVRVTLMDHEAERLVMILKDAREMYTNKVDMVGGDTAAQFGSLVEFCDRLQLRIDAALS
jgi:hypothetical protein